MLEKIKETYVDCNFVKGNVWQQYKMRKNQYSEIPYFPF